MANSSLGLFKAMHNNNPWVNNPWREDAQGNIVRVDSKPKENTQANKMAELYKDYKGTK